mgnify:CR=1 FL=1
MKLTTLPRLALVLASFALLGLATGCGKSETPAPAKTTAAPAEIGRAHV